ncbi:MAG: hypothetical protein ABIW79_07430 [Gemmatimonas sp.]
MKKIIIIASLIALSVSLKAQAITIDKDGNYVTVKGGKKGFTRQPLVSTGKVLNGKDTLYVSRTGSLFIFKTNPLTGEVTRKYFKAPMK